jgi:hypothetical protein
MDLARFIAGQSPDDEAMQIYLSFKDAGESRQLLRSVYVRALADLFRMAEAADQSRNELLYGLAGLAANFAHVILAPAASTSRGLGTESDPSAVSPPVITPALVQGLIIATRPGWSSSEGKAAGQPLVASTGDEFISVAAKASAPDGVTVTVVSGIEFAGRDVLVEILPYNTDPATAKVRLEPDEDADEARGGALIPAARPDLLLDGATLLVALLPLQSRPLTGQDCPPYPTLERLARSNDWPVEVAAHVRGCPFCKRGLVRHYEQEHVRWSDLEQYVKDSDSVSIVAQAIRDHTDECTRCAAKLLVVNLGMVINVPMDFGPAVLAFAPEREIEEASTPVEVVERQVRVTVVNSGGEYIAHVDATGPVSAVTLVVAETDGNEREYEVELQELDLQGTPYRWYGSTSIGPLQPQSVEQAWTVKAYIIPTEESR